MVDMHKNKTVVPFELGHYRLIYLEASSTITRVVVEMDPYYFYEADATERKVCTAAYLEREDEISETIIQILLDCERREARGDEAWPNTFVLHGDTYTLLATQSVWSTPSRWTFSHYDEVAQEKQALRASPTKWKFLFAPVTTSGA